MTEVTAVNLFNLGISILLMAVTVNAYFSFNLAVFRRAWALLALGSFLWFVGHVLMILKIFGPLHYILFTAFIVILAAGIYLLSRTAKRLGGV